MIGASRHTHPHTQTHARWQTGVRPGSRSSSSTLSSGGLFTHSLSFYFLRRAPCLTQTPMSLPPPPLLSPSPLNGTSLGPTVCVTSGAGQSQWGVWLCVTVCLHWGRCVCSEHFVFLRSPPMNTCFRWFLFHPLVFISHTLTHARKTHTPPCHLSVILQYSSTAGSRGRRWSRRLMDMFVYLFVLDMINWSAG